MAQARAKAKAKAKAEEEPPRDKYKLAESSASRRGGGEHGEADAPDRGGDAELRGAPPKRQRTRPSRLAMEWFSRMDDVTLIAIFEHFTNPYVSMPMVGTCRCVFMTWTKKRRQLALDQVRNLKSWLRELDIPLEESADCVVNAGCIEVRALDRPLCEIEDLIK